MENAKEGNFNSKRPLDSQEVRGQFKKIWHEQIAAKWTRSQVLSGIKTKLRNTTVKKAPLNLTRNIINPQLFDQFSALEHCHNFITYIWLYLS